MKSFCVVELVCVSTVLVGIVTWPLPSAWQGADTLAQELIGGWLRARLLSALAGAEPGVLHTRIRAGHATLQMPRICAFLAANSSSVIKP